MPGHFHTLPVLLCFRSWMISVTPSFTNPNPKQELKINPKLTVSTTGRRMGRVGPTAEQSPQGIVPHAARARGRWRWTSPNRSLVPGFLE